MDPSDDYGLCFPSCGADFPDIGFDDGFDPGWSLSWQISASWNYLGLELSGIWDSTGGAVVSAISHPVNTLGGLLNLGEAVANPYAHMNTWIGLGQAGQHWFSRLLSGDPRSLGQLAGVVVSSVATGGLGAGARVESVGESIEAAGGSGWFEPVRRVRLPYEARLTLVRRRQSMSLDTHVYLTG